MQGSDYFPSIHYQIYTVGTKVAIIQKIFINELTIIKLGPV